MAVPPTEPLAVVQWNNIIANNYPSRPFGVKRGQTFAEARKLVEEGGGKLNLVHVAFIGEDGPFDIDGEEAERRLFSGKRSSLETRTQDTSNGCVGDDIWQVRRNAKASLVRYRRASRAVHRIFERHCRHCHDRAEVSGAAEDFHTEHDIAHTSYCTYNSAVVGEKRSGARREGSREPASRGPATG